VRYYHRCHTDPDRVIGQAATFFGSRLAPVIESERTRSFSGSLGTITISVQAEGGHYTLVTASTDQPGESELDKLAKRFLGEIHTLEHNGHALRGAY
jgi:hypothetical protein